MYDTLKKQEKTVKLGVVTIDFLRNSVTIGSKVTTLSNQRLKVLEYLYDARGKVISADELMEKALGYENKCDRDPFLISQLIYKLRKIIKDKKKRHIQVVYKLGYRLVE